MKLRQGNDHRKYNKNRTIVRVDQTYHKCVKSKNYYNRLEFGFNDIMKGEWHFKTFDTYLIDWYVH